MPKSLLPMLLLALAAPLSANGPERELREVTAKLAGFDSAALARVDSVILRAVEDGATPGAALVVGRGGQLVRLRGYGHLDWGIGSPLVSEATVYDLASLTKAVGTTTLTLMLANEGKLSLDDRLSKHLRFWPRKGRHGEVRIKHLLWHTSGLPAGAAVWTRGGTRTERLAQLAKLRISSSPGARREYSDVGMMLLGALLEQVTGEPLDVLVAERVALPLGWQETAFNPLMRDIALDRIAPTELDRRTGNVLRGRVHDSNAAALAGIAGHAGLFGSARDLASFAAAMLDAARGRSNPLFSGGSFATALEKRAFGRPLGWDVPTGTRSSAGHLFSDESFGHTGFTGTSIWIDPRRDVFVVLLTNRLHPSARNQKHVALRSDVHDAVQLALRPEVAACMWVQEYSPWSMQPSSEVDALLS